MNKLFTFIAGLVFVALTAGSAYAAGLSIKIEEPKSPSNQQTVNINVVTIDVESNPITVKCYKKAPAEVSFTQFGSDIALAAGGNQTNCTTNSSVIPTEGTYQFYATANNGSETVTSSTVSIEYKLGGPETPTSYSKEGVTSCSWKIKFHTANDGKTVKVEIYRSENTSFNLDSGSRIGTVAVGPNVDSEFTTDKPDCAKTYYYAIRAFDSVGNGSGSIGDSETHTTYTTVNPTTTTPGTPGTSGAIAGGTNGNVLGATSKASPGPTEAPGSVLGEDTNPTATPTTETVKPTATSPWSNKPLMFGVAAALGIIVLWLALKKRKNV